MIKRTSIILHNNTCNKIKEPLLYIISGYQLFFLIDNDLNVVIIQKQLNAKSALEQGNAINIEVL